jgi:hypothetical protein
VGSLSRTWHIHGLVRGTLTHEVTKEVMARTFSIDTTAARSALPARARRVASENGATLLGNEASGRFSHDMARGEHPMMGRMVTVTIIGKRWLLPWPLWRLVSRSWFGSWPCPGGRCWGRGRLSRCMTLTRSEEDYA